ncbi:hypothetical protein HanRHA438_Chr05g0228531 [Helianthus annuus]|nr:hypothetical protein HanRHA438_Chr05g0228531 [Helianthus annuus]
MSTRQRQREAVKFYLKFNNTILNLKIKKFLTYDIVIFSKVMYVTRFNKIKNSKNWRMFCFCLSS